MKAQTRSALLWSLCLISGAAIAGSAVLIAIAIIPTPKPDVFDDSIDNVSAFMMDDDFQDLPARERLDYMLDLIDRLRELDQGDAVLLAEFVADMSFKMREQIEANMRDLAGDLLEESALEYAALRGAEREAFIDQFMLEIDKMGERISGRDRDISDEDRLGKMRADAKRDQERSQERGGGALSGDRVSGFFEMYENVGSEVSPTSRGSIAKLMLDVTRRLRGEELSDG